MTEPTDGLTGKSVRAVVLEIINASVDCAYLTQRDTGSISSSVVDKRIPEFVAALERLAAPPAPVVVPEDILAAVKFVLDYKSRHKDYTVADAWSHTLILARYVRDLAGK